MQGLGIIGVERKNISQNTLVAIALLVATSDPKDKHLMMPIDKKVGVYVDPY
jgi:hypothetical protein